MSRHPQFYHWNDTLATRFPNLSKPLVGLLALWSFGLILARRCGLSSVTLYLAQTLGQPANTLRQRLREFYKEAAAKTGVNQGRKRRDFAVADTFAPLLAWILSFWQCRRLVLALDPTNLGDRFHVLCLSVVYRGLALPVAWKILPGHTPGAWNPHWQDLLQRLHAALGSDWEVLVLTDRGLESAWLFRQIVALGWHPLMRVKGAGTFCPDGWHKYYAVRTLVPRVGAVFAAAGQAYKTADPPLRCSVLGCWLVGHDEPLVVLTDLPPRAANPCWYAFRAWIEQGFKVFKSAGWQWQRTRMSDASRADRLWLALAVSTLWLVAVGGEADDRIAVETVGRLPRPVGQPAPVVARPRQHRVFVQGLAVLTAALWNGTGWPPWRVAPEDWPEPWHDVPTLTESQLGAGEVYP